MKLNELREKRLNEAKKIASCKKGKLLSDSYINAHSYLIWECEIGHIWKAPFHSIRRGNWCSECYHIAKRLNYKDVKEYIQNYGFILLTKSYTNANQKLEIECPKKHISRIRASSLLHGGRGVYCPQCSDTKPKLDTLILWAKNKGGKLISTKYINKKEKLIWECGMGHRWPACWDNIYHSHSWCPNCVEGIGEKICRAYFEQLFNYRFPKTRPKWMRNSDGNLLELDGYCENIKLAFEHQGRHHYEPQYYCNGRDFERRLILDKEKIELCDKAGVILVCIPELFKLTPVKKLKDLIQQLLPDTLIKLANFSKKIDFSDVYTPRSVTQIRKAQNYAKSKNGKCLSIPSDYQTNISILTWECKKNHIWKAAYHTVVDGKQWCFPCK